MKGNNKVILKYWSRKEEKMKNRSTWVLSFLLIISLIGNVILFMKINSINANKVSNFNVLSTKLEGTWDGGANSHVKICKDGKIYWTHNTSGIISTGYIGKFSGNSIILLKAYERTGRDGCRNYQSMSEIPEAELHDIHVIYSITMYGNEAFSAQNVNTRESAYSFTKNE